MAWVETRITRTTQPQDAVGIDETNPSSAGLVRFANAGNASNGRLYDAVDPSVFYTSATPAHSVNTAGRSLAKNTTVMWEGSSSKGQAAIGTGDFTIIAGGINQSNNSSQYLATLGTATNVTGTTFVGHRSANVLALNTFNGTLAATGSVTTSGKYHCIVVSRKAGVVTFWLDGAKVGTASHASSVVSAPFGLGATTGNLKEVNFAGLFLRALSDAEGSALSLNPWQLLEPEVTRLWIDDTVSAGGAATVIPIGVQATGSVGTPSATGAATAIPVGVSASSAVGTPVAVGGASIPATVLPAGVQATAAVGTVTAIGAAVAQPAGVTASGAVGTPVAIAGTSIPATVLPAGVQASSAVGTPTVTAAAIAQPLGVAATAYVGAPTIATGVSGVAVAYPAGVATIGQVGTLIATGAAWTAAVGVQAVASVGTPTAYAGEIVIYVAGAQTRPSRLQSSSRPSRLQTGTRASR